MTRANNLNIFIDRIVYSSGVDKLGNGGAQAEPTNFSA